MPKFIQKSGKPKKKKAKLAPIHVSTSMGSIEQAETWETVVAFDLFGDVYIFLFF